MSWQAINWVREHAPEKGNELLVLLALANQSRDTDPEGGFRECWPAIETIAWESRLTPRSVYRCLERMEISGRLTIEHGGNGPKDTNSYTINTTNPRPPRKSRKMAKGDARAAKGDVLSPSKGDARAAKGDTVSSKPVEEPYPEEHQPIQRILRTRSGQAGTKRRIKRVRRKTPEDTNLSSSDDTPAAELLPVSDEENHGAGDFLVGKSPEDEEWEELTDRQHEQEKAAKKADMERRKNMDARDLARYFTSKGWPGMTDPVNERALGRKFKEWMAEGIPPLDITRMIDTYRWSERAWRFAPVPVWRSFLNNRAWLHRRAREMTMHDRDPEKAMRSLDEALARLQAKTDPEPKPEPEEPDPTKPLDFYKWMKSGLPGIYRDYLEKFTA